MLQISTQPGLRRHEHALEPALIGALVYQSWTGAVSGLLWGGLARIFLLDGEILQRDGNGLLFRALDRGVVLDLPADLEPETRALLDRLEGRQ